MSFCPRCGSEVKDGDTYCEYCGAPLVPIPQGPSDQKGSSNLLPITLIVASVIVLASMVMPYLMQPSEYTYTITVNGIGIECDADHAGYVYSDVNGDTSVYLLISVGDDEVKSQTWKVKVNEGNITLTEKNTCRFKTSSENPTFSIFLMYRTGSSGTIGAMDDMADLFDVSEYVKDVSIMPEYAGVTGVAISYDSFVDGKITLKGDSDPKGILDLSVSRE